MKNDCYDRQVHSWEGTIVHVEFQMKILIVIIGIGTVGMVPYVHVDLYEKNDCIDRDVHNW